MEQRPLLLKGGRVLDPAGQVDREADLLLREGRISRVERGIAAADARVIDATDHLVVPGLVDMHVHLREPGQEHKEEIATGTSSAAAGGFTTVCCMPNTTPVNDGREVTELIVRRTGEVGLVRVHPIGAITIGLKGEQLCSYKEMKEAGAVALSDDGRCVMNAALLRRAMEAARELDLPLIQHCEDDHLSGHGAMTEGEISAQIGLSAQPPQAESVIVARDVELVQLTGCRYHVAHISTAGALRHLRQGRALGLPVSCEAAPHHFTLTDESCRDRDPRAKVNPPLRSARDVAALLEAISDGTVDAIATDHAPHAAEDKEVDFEQAAFGIAGLETAVPLALRLWRDGVVSLSRVVAMMTCNPAKILGLESGTLAAGACADVAVIDPDRTWRVEPSAWRSKGMNTPFDGSTMRGAVKVTVADGRVVFEG